MSMKNSYIVIILFHVDSMIGACLKIFRSKISLGLENSQELTDIAYALKVIYDAMIPSLGAISHISLRNECQNISSFPTHSCLEVIFIVFSFPIILSCDPLEINLQVL